jgi:hypothetical protein
MAPCLAGVLETALYYDIGLREEMERLYRDVLGLPASASGRRNRAARGKDPAGNLLEIADRDIWPEGPGSPAARAAREPSGQACRGGRDRAPAGRAGSGAHRAPVGVHPDREPQHLSQVEGAEFREEQRH